MSTPATNGDRFDQWALLRRIFSFAVPYRGRLCLALLLTLVGASITLVLPLGIRTLLDDALANGDRDLLHLLGAGLLILFVLRAIVGFFGTYVMQITSERMVIDLRQRLYRHYQCLDLGFFHQRRVGDLLSRLDNDTDSIQQTVSSIVSSTAVNLFKLVGAIVLMVTLDPKLSLLVLFMAPAATLLSRRFGMLLHDASRQVQERLADATSAAQEALSAVQLVQSYDRGDHECQRYGRTLQAFFETAKREVKIHAFFTSLVSFLSVLSTIAIFWYGGSQVLRGALQVGDVVAFLFYSQMISQNIGLLAEQYGAVSRMTGSAERIFELLDTQPTVVERPGARALDAVAGKVSFEGVSFAYGDGELVLAEVDFRVEPGWTVALVGRSGAGKSTLLRLLPRLFDPTAGRILLDGHDLRELRLADLRSQLAFVSQEVQLFATTVRENIRYGRLDASDAEVEAAARLANADGFIRDLPQGWETEVGERGVKLSGGQRQRIAIARALLRDAAILILDEATSSIDTESEAAIQEALDRLRANRTTFVAAHRLSTVLDADRILVLDGGRVAAFGRHQDLVARPGLYRRLVRKHFRGHATALREAVA
ncbi:MAG: ABC transporter ATP-binding protein [Alphaproteobacteria bacterium]|nr:MAG: ABC transporter ATP-binding protein [Alphaproteobacteria bacterium]